MIDGKQICQECRSGFSVKFEAINSTICVQMKNCQVQNSFDKKCKLCPLNYFMKNNNCEKSYKYYIDKISIFYTRIIFLMILALLLST